MNRMHLALILSLVLSACGNPEAAKESAQTSSTTPAPKVVATTPAPAPTEAPATATVSLPERVDPEARYLFYLHGQILEEKGIEAAHPKFGKYEYENILAAFRDKGFVVLSELRPRGTDVREYADKLAGQVKTLIDRGVSPRHITLVGASKGGVMVALASGRIKNREVNIVILAGCFKPMTDKQEVDLWGRVLSIYDSKDHLCIPCRPLADKSTGVAKFKEITLHLNLGHGMLYKPLKDWVDPAAAWALEK